MKCKQALFKPSGVRVGDKGDGVLQAERRALANGPRWQRAQCTGLGMAGLKGGGSDGEGGVYTDKERQEQGLEHGEQAGPETGLCPDGSSKSEEGHLMNALDL